MRTTNSVCAGIVAGGAGAGDCAGAAADASGVARRNTGLSLSPDDEDEEVLDAESDEGRRSVGLLPSEDEDESEEDESEEDDADEDRFNVGRESSDDAEDPEEEGYDPESFGSGWRITGREPAVREPEPEPEP